MRDTIRCLGSSKDRACNNESLKASSTDALSHVKALLDE